MLRWRLPLSVFIVATLAGLCWLDARAALPGLWLMPAAIVFTTLATADVLYLAAQGGMKPRPAIVLYLCNLALVLAPWMSTVARQIAWTETPWTPPDGMLAVWILAIGLTAVFLGEMRRYQKPGGITANIAAAMFAMIYVGVMLGFAVQLRLDWGIGAVASWVVAVKMGDIGAYTVGRLIGRHKMAPVLSPGKTMEGAVGALAFSCLGSWAVFAWLAGGQITGAGALAKPVAHAGWTHGWGWLAFGLLMRRGG